MELNEMEKKLLFQVEVDDQTKILSELYMTVRYSNNSEQGEAAEGLMAKLRVLSNAECMDLSLIHILVPSALMQSMASFVSQNVGAGEHRFLCTL